MNRRLPRPRRGSLMRAADVAAIGEGAERGVNFGVTGADVATPGRQTAVRLPYVPPSILVRIETAWQVAKPSPPEKPKHWAYCDAVRVGHEDREGWVKMLPTATLRLWHPTGPACSRRHRRP